MKLTAAQIQQFRTQGYLVIPHFFDKRETDALRSEVERLVRIGKLRNIATDGDGKTASTKVKNLQLCPMFKESDLYRAVPFCPKVSEAVSDLIGDPYFLHLDQVFLKPGGDGMGTNWHQDNAYFKISDPLKGTAMWIAAHDATLANGTMRIVPGVFKQEFPHERDPMSNHHIRCYPDESKAVPCELEAGGVIFFCYGTPHCTGANTTKKERAGLAFHFLHESVALGTTYAEQFKKEDRDYNPYITGPNATGGKKEYGVKVAGTWESEVDKALQQAELVGAK